MTKDEAIELQRIESAEIEAEIRARHTPIVHHHDPCPTGGCCSCGAVRGCDAGWLIQMLDIARQAAAHPAEGQSAGEG